MGTKEGGIKAKATIEIKYGADHWKKIGAIGGRNGTTGGYAYDGRNRFEKLIGRKKAAVRCGRKGGRNKLGWRKKVSV